MAGSSRRKGAVRKAGTKKGPVVGSGGQRRRGLRGKGPTPPAELRPGHPAQRRAEATARKAAGADAAARKVAGAEAAARKAAGASAAGRKAAGAEAAGRKAARTSPVARRWPSLDSDGPETVLGRNPVVECLRAGVPATALHVAAATTADERIAEAVRLAADTGVPILEVPRTDLDRMATGAPHQGIALTVPPYSYAHPDELLAAARGSSTPPLIVALDGVTDPRNLGAVVRSAAAFGAHGVLLPERRSAGMTAVAWRACAGAAARIRVARATNLTRTLREYAGAGLMVAGLDAGGAVSVDDLELASGPLALVVGSEGRGLSRLVRETCDVTVAIPMSESVESLNASVAAGVLLAEVARRRRTRP